MTLITDAQTLVTAAGVLLALIALGYWGRFLFIVQTPGTMTDAFLWTLFAFVLFGTAAVIEQVGGA